MAALYGSRKSIRLKHYDYLQDGYYFVTICAKDRKFVFGNIHDSEVILTDAGKMVESTWFDLPNHNNNIELDEFIVMPNHVHGIISIVGAGSKPALNDKTPDGINIRAGHVNIRAGLEPAPTSHGLPEIIRQFKTFSAKRINKMNNDLPPN